MRLNCPYERELMLFLKHNEIVFQWRNYIRYHHLGDCNNNILTKRILKRYKPSEYIRSFNWQNTNEGIIFWDRINTKWLVLLRRLKSQ